MLFKYFLLVVVLFYLQACGEGESNLSAPTLTFVASNLDQYGGVVPTTVKNIEITVAEDLDPNSLSQATVHLMVGESHQPADDGVDPDTDPNASEQPNTGSPHNQTPDQEKNISGGSDTIAGSVAYDALRKTVIFTPSRALESGVTYHLRIQNIKLADGRTVNVIPAADGKELGAIQFNFQTIHVHEILRTRYDKDGNETAYVTFNVINNKRVERRQYNKQKEIQLQLQYGVLLPPPSTRVAKRLYRDKNGEISQYDYDVVENGVVTASLRVKEPGPDNFWGTDDDLLVSWTQRNQEHLTHTITKTYTLEDKSAKVPWVGVNSPGFILRTIYLEEHGGPNFQHRDIFYRDLGVNGEIDIDPATQEITRVDDTISLWHKRDFINGKRVRSWSIGGVGKGEGFDNQLFTDDDVATGLSTLEYYPDDGSLLANQLRKLVTYYESGVSYPLNQWLADEANNIVQPGIKVHSYRIYNYDAAGNRTEEISYSPGDDGLMETPDDYITQRKIYSTVPTINGGQQIGIFN